MARKDSLGIQTLQILQTITSEAYYKCVSGNEKAHKHKQFCPVTAWVRGVSRLGDQGSMFMCCVRNPRDINIFVPGGSVTGVTEE